jgi:hypothetical protein
MAVNPLNCIEAIKMKKLLAAIAVSILFSFNVSAQQIVEGVWCKDGRTGAMVPMTVNGCPYGWRAIR